MLNVAKISRDLCILCKYLRLSEMCKSKITIQIIVQVLQNKFADPCSDELEMGELYNLASGFALPNFEVSTVIINPSDVFRRRCKLNFGPM